MYFALISIMIIISAYLAGLFSPALPVGTKTPENPEEYKCCDTGDGKNCRPVPGTDVSVNGGIYGLLKSDVFMTNITEGAHFDPVPHGFIDGQPIFVNIMPGQQTYYQNLLRPGRFIRPNCRVPNNRRNIDEYREKWDWLIVAPPGGPDPANPLREGCYQIPNDMLIYKCRADSPAGACDRGLPDARTARFDVYIRLSDVPGGDINSKYEFLTECFKPPVPKRGEEAITYQISPGGQPNLQLRTFRFLQAKTPASWVSPWCKPAIYLYPERKTEINVSVFPQGELLLTIPEYPKNGWDVIADPNGDIHYGSDRFDYLYYEAALPDHLITKPKEGYVIPYNERALFLTDLVTKLGLNEKETKQFVEYWVPILPEANYYFIGVIPQKHLDELSPVLITPKPKNTIRVTLFFQPLDNKITVSPPLILPVSRDGYTAVEWGGIFKQTKNHPFTCFM